MDKKEAHEIYNNCMNVNLSDLLNVIDETKDDEERRFYVTLYNYVMQKEQKVLVKNGIF